MMISFFLPMSDEKDAVSTDGSRWEDCKMATNQYVHFSNSRAAVEMTFKDGIWNRKFVDYQFFCHVAVKSWRGKNRRNHR